MKIYTQTYDLAKASPHRFWVAPFSEFKIGIKILEKDEISSKDFTLKAGSIEFTPDEDKIDNFTLFTIKSNDTGFVDYTIEVEGVAEKLKLMQIVTDSTVFEIDAGGGGDVPADVATKTWVNSQISDFVTEDALDGYATENYVDSATSSFVEEGELTAYATKDELTAYAETTDLTAYAEKTDLTAYYTKSETSSATEISTALDGKQPAGDYALTSQIPTVNDGTLTILQGGIEKGKFTANQTGNVSVELDAGGGDMSNYYTKSETSSATEIGTALEGKQPAGNYLTAETEPAFAAMSADIVVDDDLTAFYTKSETSSATELSGEFSTVSALADSAYNMADSAYGQLGSKVDHKAGGTAPEVLNIETYYESEYSQLSVDDPSWEPDPSTMYVILPDPA